MAEIERVPTGVRPTNAESNPDWSRVLLVEGTSGIGKSTLIDALLRRYVAEQPARRLRTVLHLTQAHTFGPLAAAEDAGTLTPDGNITHLDAVVSVIEWHVASLRAETKVKCVVLIDTLHLTQCFRPGVLSWVDVEHFDRRLARIGARLLFLHGSADTIWNRGLVPREHEQFVTGYAIPKFGSSLEAVHRYFANEQDEMRSLVPRSAMRSLVLDTDRDVADATSEAYRFWLE